MGSTTVLAAARAAAQRMTAQSAALPMRVGAPSPTSSSPLACPGQSCYRT